MAPFEAGMLALETATRMVHVGGLQTFVLPEGAGPDIVRDLYLQAIAHGDVLPELSRRAVRSFATGGYYGWDDDDEVDLSYHVRHSALPDPHRPRELLELTSRLHSQRLDRSRPLWEGHLVEGLAGNRVAVYAKVHHALVDGISAMKILERGLRTDAHALDTPPFFAPQGPRPAKARARRGLPDPVGLLTGTVRGGLGAVSTFGEGLLNATSGVLDGLREESTVLPMQAPKTVFNAPVGAARRFAADSWPKERFAAVQQRTGASSNDVVTAVLAGALRAYLLELGELPDAPLVALVPMSLRDRDDTGGGNSFGLILCNLGTHVEDPAARLALVRQSMDDGKARIAGKGMGVAAMTALPSVLALLTQLTVPGGAVAGRGLANVIISNVPGPREPLYWNGARLEAVYPASIVLDGLALNITLTSYADQLCFGFLGCRDAVPHLQRLLQHTEDALAALEEATA